jgi:hypothetical protein
MNVRDLEDLRNYDRKSEVWKVLNQIDKEKLELDSPQAIWLKENYVLRYYKLFKNRGLGADFIESPEMKPYVNTEYLFEKPTEQANVYDVFSRNIGKTHYDYGQFLLQSKQLERENETEKIHNPQYEPKKETLHESAPKQSNGIFSVLSEKNINANVAGKYSNTHFRIDKNGYDGSGRNQWSDGVRAAYEAELAAILTANGWRIEESDKLHSARHATKGRNFLYLHPQDFSGVCENSERESLYKALAKAETFVCHSVDVYAEVYDMTDEELAEKLSSEKDTIESELLEAFATKRSNLYITTVGAHGADGRIAKQHSVKRLAMGDKRSFNGVDSRTDGICVKFVGDIFRSLVDSGRIIT